MILSVLLWISGNKLQDAIKRTGEARTEEAKRGAEEARKQAADALRDAGIANEKAGNANERASKLERDNLQLRTDLENATAESRTKQAELAKEQTKLASEQGKTAKAQRAADEAQLALKKHLEEEIERRKPRQITLQQRARLVEILSAGPKGSVDIECVLGDGEGLAFANQIDEVLKAAGWTTTGVSQGVFTPTNPAGAGILVHSGRTAPPYAGALQHAFGSVGLPLGGLEQGQLPEGKVQILVGVKP